MAAFGFPTVRQDFGKMTNFQKNVVGKSDTANKGKTKVNPETAHKGKTKVNPEPTGFLCVFLYFWVKSGRF